MNRFPVLFRRSLIAMVTSALACVGLVTTAVPASAAITRPFTPVFTANTTGDIMLRGNTLLTCPAGSTGGSISCATAQGGSTGQNNSFAMVMVDVDADATTFNSSSATVTLPVGATVLYAGLSWAANTAGEHQRSRGSHACEQGVALLKAPGGAYASVTSTLTDGGSNFQAYADVTARVSSAGSGVYTVANVQAGTGNDRYAGWSLVIGYRDPSQPTRNLVVYTGYGTVTASDPLLNIPVSGFTTPLSGPVVTRLGTVVYEGDRKAVGDRLTLGSTGLSNALNPADDVFNSTITDLGVEVPDRTPSYVNQLGFDIDRFDATGVLPRGATSTTIQLTTSSETFFPGIVTFATDLYSPLLTATKSVTDVNGGTVAPGDLLDYSIGITNTGGDASTASVLTDAVPSGSSYVAGSLVVGGTAVTDAAADDAGNFGSGNVTAHLGTGATGAVGGRLGVGASTTVAFRVRVSPSAADAATIVNTATLAYTSETTGTALTGASNTVTSTVVLAPTLTFGTLPAGAVGTDYSNQLTLTGGLAPYTWSISAGALPAGLTLDPGTGLISGTPTALGTSAFTVRVSDTHGHTDAKASSILVTLVATTLGLTRSATTVPFGNTVTLTATVVPPGATGTVTFTNVPVTGPDSGTTVTLGTRPVSAAVASISPRLPAFGLNTVTATYNGDATHAAATSAPVTVEVTAYAGEVIITELRSSGPGGTGDKYVELYNTGRPVPLSGFRITSSGGGMTTLPVDAPSLGTNRSYLLAGNLFSLDAVGSADLVTSGIGSGGFKVLAPDTAATQTDAVGPDAFSLGTPLPAMTGSPNAQYAWVRIEKSGRPVNTSNNSADFALVSTNGAVVGGVQSMLGSASPTGSIDAYQHNSELKSYLLDASKTAAEPPNRVYAVGSPGSLIVRRTITNTSDETITVAKARITALSEANGLPHPSGTQPPTVALLRAVNPGTATSQVAVTGGGTVTVQNLSLDAPVVPASGGGLNSTMTIPLPGGTLTPGESVYVAFTFAVDTRGTFWFGYDVDAFADAGAGQPEARVDLDGEQDLPPARTSDASARSWSYGSGLL